MIDDSDVDLAIACTPDSGPWWLIGLFLVLVCTMYFVAKSNEQECSQRMCDPGLSARVIDHECLCVKAAK